MSCFTVHMEINYHRLPLPGACSVSTVSHCYKTTPTFYSYGCNEIIQLLRFISEWALKNYNLNWLALPGEKKYLYITTYLLFKGALVFSKERGLISPKGFKLIDLLLAMATDHSLTNLWPVCIWGTESVDHQYIFCAGLRQSSWSVLT